MLITDREILRNYTAGNLLWAGIPSIEVTRGGRTYLTFYSGGTREEIGNYCLLICADKGKAFGDPIAVCYAEGCRCFDPCLWLDPLGRLWFTWSRCPQDGVFGAICQEPDAENPVFGEEFFIGHNIMMNKPTVLSTGEWLFPLAVWNHGIRALPPKYDSQITPKGSFAYVSYDQGRSFQRLGGANVENRSFDEHMFLEKQDGTVRCFVRTAYGIGAADSYDGGAHWAHGFDTGYRGPDSRFHIRRLPSGRVLLINHYDYNGRNNLTAMLSEDDGQTFPYRLLLDERQNVSYPDAAIDSQGMIHIVYDRERGGFQSSLEEVSRCAREILIARISEEDILSGKLVDSRSSLKNVAYKLTEYTGRDQNPFHEKARFTDWEYAEWLNSTNDSSDDIISRIFDAYKINCTNIHHIGAKKLDALIEEYRSGKKLETLNRIIHLVRCADSVSVTGENEITDNICKFVAEHIETDCTLEDIANALHYSTHYIRHLFKKSTGISVGEYKTAQRVKKAKLMLRTTNFSITDIALACGYNSSSYFAEIFTKEVGIAPKDYRGELPKEGPR